MPESDPPPMPAAAAQARTITDSAATPTADHRALGSSDGHVTSEKGDATYTTAQHNVAYQHFHAWITEFRGVARCLFFKYPGGCHMFKI